MPNYPFEDSKGIYSEFFFKMVDAPKIGSTVEIDGKAWKRLPSIPYAASDSVDGCPFDAKSFIKATNKGGGTFGDMMDLSKEYSERRKQKDGVDEIAKKANAVQKQAYDTLGITPPEEKSALAQQRLKKLGVTVKEKVEKKRDLRERKRRK